MFIEITPWGIPPQIIGSLTPDEQRIAMSYAETDRHVEFDILTKPWDDVEEDFRPFLYFSLSVEKAFRDWNALTQQATLYSDSSHLNSGETTFNSRVHSDMPDCEKLLAESNELSVRVLCPSSDAPIFIDYTKLENGWQNVAPFRDKENPRIYNPKLLDWAKEQGLIVKPKPWDIVMFDGNTPHRAIGATRPGRRKLDNSLIKTILPPNWRVRAASRDYPHLKIG